MPVARKLDKYWVDHNFSYLVHRLGLFPLFEPSGFFYEDLATPNDTTESGTVFARAAGAIFLHAGVAEIPVSFTPGMAGAGEFQFIPNPRQPGGMIPSCIRISDRYGTIRDPRARGMAFGTILAHEVAHYCLMEKGILRETTDNERLTDLGLMVLGLGKLYFNGRNLVIGERRENPGYLQPLDMTYAFMEHVRHNAVPVEALTTNLSADARQVLVCWLGDVNHTIKEYRRQEMISEDEEERLLVVAKKEDLESDVRKALVNIRRATTSLAAAANDQDIINRTIRFWEIGPDDHRVMGEFVAALSSGTYEAGLAGISRPLLAMEQDLAGLAGDLKRDKTVQKDWNIPAQKIAQLTKDLSVLNDRMAAAATNLSAAGSAHRHCFRQIDPVLTDLKTTRTTISTCNTVLSEIRSLHEFFTANPAAWPGYAGTAGPGPEISSLIRSSEQEHYLSRTEEEAAQAASFLSGPKEKYAERFGASPPLAGIAVRARSEGDGAAAALQTLQHHLSSQEGLLQEYLEEVRRLESRLQDLRATATLTEKEIHTLKPRQDVIYAQYHKVRIAPEDEPVFAGITQAIFSCAPDADLAHVTRLLAELTAAVQQDAQRVKGRSESALILPLEARREEVNRAEADLQKLGACIFRWHQAQQAYLDRIEQLQQRSPGRVLRDLGTGIRESLQALARGQERDPKR